MIEDSDVCDLRQMRRIAALLDRDPAGIQVGAPLPPGWHFALFTSVDRQSLLRSDGYVASNAAGLAELADMEVMLAGRRTEYNGLVTIGSALRRRTDTRQVTRKQGRSGPLIFLTLIHEIFVAEGTSPAIIEEEDFVYRLPMPPVPDLGAPPAEHVDFLEPFMTSETLLFRYSALGYNAHRIHYDRTYAVDVAGFPDLVVNGGLVAVSLLNMFARRIGIRPRTVTTKSVRPLYCGKEATLALRENEDGGWSLAALNDRGALAMQVNIQ